MSKKWWVIIIILIVLIGGFFLTEFLLYERCKNTLHYVDGKTCRIPIYEKRYDKIFYEGDYCLDCCTSLGESYIFKCNKGDFKECSGSHVGMSDGSCVIPYNADYLEYYLKKY